MSPSPFRLSQWQLALLTFYLTLCVTPFTYDAVMLVGLRRQAWLGLIPALGIGLLGTALALGLMRRFPGEPVVGYAPRLLGPLAGRAYLLLLGLVLLDGAGGNLHVFAEMVRETELPRTSLIVPSLVSAAVCALGCWFGPEVVARFGEVFVPVVALGLMVIFLAPLRAGVLSRLLPLSGFAWSGYWPPDVSSSLGTVRGFLPLLVLGGWLRRPAGFPRRAILALLAAWILLILGLIEPVIVLGPDFAASIHFPLFAVTGTVDFRWFPFQRLTIVTVLIWQAIVYVVVAFYLWSGSFVLCAACGIRRWRLLLIPAAVATLLLAGGEPGARSVRTAVDVWNYAVVAVAVGGMALLQLLAASAGRAPGGSRARRRAA